jgi:hypothetical protein
LIDGSSEVLLERLRTLEIEDFYICDEDRGAGINELLSFMNRIDCVTDVCLSYHIASGTRRPFSTPAFDFETDTDALRQTSLLDNFLKALALMDVPSRSPIVAKRLVRITIRGMDFTDLSVHCVLGCLGLRQRIKVNDNEITCRLRLENCRLRRQN